MLGDIESDWDSDYSGSNQENQLPNLEGFHLHDSVETSPETSPIRSAPKPLRCLTNDLSNYTRVFTEFL